MNGCSATIGWRLCVIMVEPERLRVVYDMDGPQSSSHFSEISHGREAWWQLLVQVHCRKI